MSKFGEVLIAYILRQAEGTAISEVCRTGGIFKGTFYDRCKEYGGLLVSDMKRLKQLEDENSKLKKPVADLSLDGPCCRTSSSGNP